MENIEATTVTWETVLARAAESLCQTGTTGRRLRPRRTPEREYHPNVARQIDQVDGRLMDLFRKLSHGQAPWPLFLHGPVGSGKTCAALALSDLVETDWFGSVEDVCDTVMQRLTRRWTRDHGNDWTPPPANTFALVVLDEVGARQKVTDLEYTTVKAFADVRELDHGRVATYISNLEPDAISRVYDDRIASRLLCGTWFKLAGKDRRMDQV